MKGKILLLIAALSMFGSAVNSNENKKSILKNQRLVVALDTSNYNYFLQKGNPCGYQLELFELFAKHEGVTLDFCIAPDSLKFDMLLNGDVDIVVFSKGLDSLHNVFDRYEKISSSIALDDNVKSVWLSRDENMSVILSVNVWASKLKGEDVYKSLQTKYFGRKYKKTDKGISPYDNVLKKYSAAIGWDWRLTASMVFHESRFKPDRVSKSGAKGLMQLMPNTVRRFGVKNVYNPEENIKGGLRLIAYLSDFFEKNGVPEDERIYFVLASYNAGHGKIVNFMKMAENLGFDKYKWSDIRSTIMLNNRNGELVSATKSKFNGKETVKFVDNVLKNYKHYRNFYQ
ncbi:MAG: transglycosylase SLT domain-containing protein [Prevotellaceae bacterium]|jgi:membrane-bound lytic murein transglycosylase F|nr:transglycosylase SLT domain-containing protein [Prevotellaceae bacterium]